MVPALVALLLAAYAPDGLALTPEQFWHTPYGVEGWVPMAGDADGDGHADLLVVAPGVDGHIEMARTSPMGKPIANVVALKGFGANVVTAACGPFKRGSAADVAAVFADGSVRVAWGMTPETTAYLHNDLAAQIPPEAMPKGPARAVMADFDGDDRADILILDANGRLTLLQNRPLPGGAPGFAVYSLATTLPDVRRFVAGKFGIEKRGRCVWLSTDGMVSSALVEKGELGPTTPIVKATGDSALAAGRFHGAKGADLVVGQKLLRSGDPKAATEVDGLPTDERVKDEGSWMIADLDGNGKDDILRNRRGKERWGATDVVVHYSYEPDKEDPGYYSTANDGLPDVWKTGKLRPGGLDLKTMGCKVGHRDLIVELERFENVDLADLRNNMNRAAQYFASIPLKNPDGTNGIALHVMYREPWPMKDHDKIRAHFNDYFPRPGNRGIAHMMFAEQNGPLDAGIDASVGRFNGGWAVFVHEIGHQLDLVHDGFYGSGSGWSSDTGSSIYPSLMSYTYSYGLDNSGENIGYSDGARASLVLNPQHLSERLPFRFDTVRFLGAEPYHFRLQRTPDDRSTLIDWNWNGVFGEEDVAADVNYTHGTDFGPTYDVARTDQAPALVVHGDRPILAYAQGSTLALRAWSGRNRDTEGGRWTEPTADFQAGITGDPTLAYLGDGISWIAYPTAKGVVVRSLTLDGAGRPRLGTASLLSDTVGAQPTAVALDGRLILLLWHSKSLPVGLRLLRPRGEGMIVTGERPLGFDSDAPVGAIAGKAGDLWVQRIEPDGRPNGGRDEILRLAVDAGGGTKTTLRAFMEGVYARRRLALLWREEGAKLPDGRVYGIGGGAGNDQYIAMNTPYPDYSNGWILHRYRSPSFTSLSTPGACFFQGDILIAFRNKDNDRLDVAFYGSGATPWNVGDFDDVGHIRDYGLSHSIREVTK